MTKEQQALVDSKLYTKSSAVKPMAPVPCSTPPPAKKGWDHSERVLVWYAADPESDHTDTWSIAYYHYKPPYKDKPGWVDFSITHWGSPTYWWPLPELPTAAGESPAAGE